MDEQMTLLDNRSIHTIGLCVQSSANLNTINQQLQELTNVVMALSGQLQQRQFPYSPSQETKTQQEDRVPEEHRVSTIPQSSVLTPVGHEPPETQNQHTGSIPTSNPTLMTTAGLNRETDAIVPLTPSILSASNNKRSRPVTRSTILLSSHDNRMDIVEEHNVPSSIDTMLASERTQGFYEHHQPESINNRSSLSVAASVHLQPRSEVVTVADESITQNSSATSSSQSSIHITVQKATLRKFLRVRIIHPNHRQYPTPTADRMFWYNHDQSGERTIQLF